VPLIRGRLRLRREGHAGQPAESDYVEIDTAELSGIFAAPGWLRDIGISAWLLVGITAFVLGVVWLLSLTSTIVVPVIVALIIAAVTEPAVGWLRRHRVPRGVGAALVLLVILLLGAGVLVMILAGVTGELSTLSSQLQSAASDISGWLKDIGVDPGTADGAKNDASKTLSDIAPALLNGVATGIKQLSSLVFFLAMTILSLFFLLADGPRIRGWVEGHLGVPDDVARVVTGRTLGAMRGYFLGVTIVAAYSATVVGVGALIIGVPLAGTIAIVTFVGGFVPYLGAWTAGAFAVLMALGGGGTDAAAAMAVLQLLANGILQQLVQPFAMGTALGIHPLAVLIVTIAGGALFGAVGLILAAPLVSAAVRISADLSKARSETGDEAPAPASGPPPAPA
jgi:predicted PurR-regulated permease PerM